MTRFPARHEVPEFSVFASLLRMTTKYGFNDVRGQLLKDLEGAYPTKWEDFKAAKVLGEAVFGSPRPHPNSVLNLFEAQDVRFAIPFAAYRASAGDFSALMSDEPGTVLSRRTLATTIRGMLVTSAARVIAYGGCLPMCPDEACIFNAGIDPMAKRMAVLDKIYTSNVGEGESGVLSPPSLGDLPCAKCAGFVEVIYDPWGSVYWENLPQVFGVSDSWDDL